MFIAKVGDCTEEAMMASEDYSVLAFGVTSDASDDDIKKEYHKNVLII